MKINLLKSNKGMTLIELVISIAILTVILISTYTFFFYSNRTFSKGVNQYSIQSNIRVISDYIMDELRYATKVEILDNIDPILISDPLNNIAAYSNYLFYNKGEIIRLSRYNSKSFNIGPGGVIEFSNTSINKVLNFTIQGIDSKQKYSLKFEVKPLNLDIEKKYINAKTGPVLFYQTVSDYLAQTVLPEATLGDPLDPEKIKVHFSKRIENVEVISDSALSPSSNIKIVDSNNIELIIEPPGASEGREIIFVAQLDDLGLYEYTLTYIKEWNIK